MSDNVQRGHRHPFEPSREFLSCNVAGFGHWDGVLIFDKLEPGTHLRLEAEPDNPYDARAIALYYKDTKIGFIPRDMNLELSPLLFFGHEDIFDTVITQVRREADPEHQVRVMVRIRDARN
jgi:HIRAN domain.